MLDASITAPWFLPDEASDASDDLYTLMRRGELIFHAPELWLWECGNIIANAVKRQRLTATDAFLAWSAVDSIRTRVVFAEPQPSHVAAVLKLAIDHCLSVYDAAYLRLASSLELPLLTSDRALGRAAAVNGVRALSLKDLA